jgi:uncharacterized membrane protein
METLTKKSFNIKEALDFGWASFKKQWKALILAVLVAAISLAAVNALNLLAEFLDSLILGLLIAVGGWVLQKFIMLVWNILALAIADQEMISWSHMKKSYVFLWKFIALSIVYNVAVFLGLILLIAPGVYLAIKWQFWPFVLLENKDMNITDILEKSSEITNGVKWKLLGLAFVFLGVMILGLICLVIGVIPAFLAIGIATAYIYRSLNAQTTLVGDQEKILEVEPPVVLET